MNFVEAVVESTGVADWWHIKGGSRGMDEGLYSLFRKTSVFAAEVWAIKEGLSISLRLNITCLEIESDASNGT